VRGVTDAVSIAAGAGHSCVVNRTAQILCWGRSDRGQLGATPAKMSIVIHDDVLDGAPVIEILRDGTSLRRAAWGAASPVDPGVRVVEARAKGKKSIRIEVRASSGALSEVVIPVLENEPEKRAETGIDAAPTAKPVAVDRPGGATIRAAAVVIGAVGVGALGAGAYFGLRTFDLDQRAKSQCPAAVDCNPEALEANADAKAAARLANIAVFGGLLAVGGGVALYLLAPKARTTLGPYGNASAGGAIFTTVY
jgi:Regulator of chromosome condensation (RCC1) repeat